MSKINNPFLFMPKEKAQEDDFYKHTEVTVTEVDGEMVVNMKVPRMRAEVRFKPEEFKKLSGKDIAKIIRERGELDVMEIIVISAHKVEDVIEDGRKKSAAA